MLRVAVVVVGLAVLASGAALGLVKAGDIGNENGSAAGTGSSGTPPAHHASVAAPNSPLVTPVSTGAGTATLPGRHRRLRR